MTSELKDKIAKLKELAGNATQGEWTANKRYIKSQYAHILALTQGNCDAVMNRMECIDAYDNAEFIASANPATILELIAEIEALEKEADWLANEHISNITCGDPHLEMERYERVDALRELAREAVREGK